MSEAIAGTQGLIYSPSFSNTGVSIAYESLRKQLLGVIEHTREMVDKQKTFSLVEEVYKECSEEDWDGYGAKPIKEEAYLQALELVDALPSSLPLPEVIPERSGDLALEWSKGRRAVLVISVSGETVIHYAGIFGTSKIHGSEYLEDFLPQVIIENISRLGE